MSAHAYWRIYISANNGDQYCCVTELGFRTQTGGTNVSGTPISSGDLSSNFVKAYAFDGLTTTKWADQGYRPSWIGLYSATPVEITQIAVTGSYDTIAQSPRDFQVQYSDDGVVWVTAVSIANQTAWAINEVRTFAVVTGVLSGTFYEDTPITDWLGVALRCKDGVLIGSQLITGSTYNINVYTTEPCVINVYPRIDEVWRPSKNFLIGTYVVSATPDNVPHIWKCMDIGDSTFSTVTLQLHFNGANNSTMITDNSLSANVVTAYGNAKISTAQSVFNGSSCYLDGTNSYLQIPTGSWIDFATNDFCMEGRFYCTNISGSNQLIFCRQDNNASDMAMQVRTSTTNKLELVLRAQGGGSVYTITGTTTLVSNTWYAFSIDRVNNVFTLRLNGVTEGTLSQTLNLSSTADAFIGSIYSHGNYFGGYVAEFRITNGMARHTTDYTVATSAFIDCTTGTTEPSFALTGNTIDNNITWAYVAPLVTPITIGPRIPTPYV